MRESRLQQRGDPDRAMADRTSETMSYPSLHPSERKGALPARTANAIPHEAAAPHTPHFAHVAPGTHAAREPSSANASERPAPSW